MYDTATNYCLKRRVRYLTYTVEWHSIFYTVCYDLL